MFYLSLHHLWPHQNLGGKISLEPRKPDDEGIGQDLDLFVAGDLGYQFIEVFIDFGTLDGRRQPIGQTAQLGFLFH